MGVSVEKRFLRFAQNDEQKQLQLQKQVPSGMTSKNGKSNSSSW
jgi:hypothetical protein